MNSHKGRNTLHLRVYPNADRDEVIGFNDGIWQVRVAAPPVKGQANRKLTVFLSQALRVNQSSLTIVKGHTSRHKVIAVAGLSQEEIINRLST